MATNISNENTTNNSSSMARPYTPQQPKPQLNKVASLYNWSSSMIKTLINDINKDFKLYSRIREQIATTNLHKRKNTYPKWLPIAKYKPITAGRFDLIHDYEELNREYNYKLLQYRLEQLMHEETELLKVLNFDRRFPNIRKNFEDLAITFFGEYTDNRETKTIPVDFTERINQDITDSINYIRENLTSRLFKLKINEYNTAQKIAIREERPKPTTEVDMETPNRKEISDLVKKLFNNFMKNQAPKKPVKKTKPKPKPKKVHQKKPKNFKGKKNFKKPKDSNPKPKPKGKGKGKSRQAKKSKN